MKVSITGASGHVGANLCRLLEKSGAEIKVLVHHTMNKLPDLKVEIVNGDLFDKQSLIRLFSGADVVFHLAVQISIDSRNKSSVYKTNVEGTANVIEICKTAGVKKLVHFSTIHTLKSSGVDQEMNENNPLITQSNIVYEHSKAEAERLVLASAAEGLDAVVLNPTAIIGPDDFKPSYLGQAFIKIYKNQLPMLVPGGYDFVDVRDVAEAAISAATNGRRGERYILSGQWLSLKELSMKIGRLTGNNTPGFVAPTWLAKAGLPFIYSWAKLSDRHPLYTSESLEILKSSNRNISSQKAKNELGFAPRPIEETLRDMFRWFEENQKI
jgi:dihydroflavonol-4-reductase